MIVAVAISMRTTAIFSIFFFHAPMVTFLVETLAIPTLAMLPTVFCFCYLCLCIKNDLYDLNYIYWLCKELLRTFFNVELIFDFFFNYEFESSYSIQNVCIHNSTCVLFGLKENIFKKIFFLIEAGKISFVVNDAFIKIPCSEIICKHKSAT